MFPGQLTVESHRVPAFGNFLPNLYTTALVLGIVLVRCRSQGLYRRASGLVLGPVLFYWKSARSARMLVHESAVPPTPPLRLKSVEGWTPAYSSPQTVFKPTPPTSNSFATPLLDSLFTPQETGQSRRARPAPDSSRSGVAVPKGGERKLDITVIDHPNCACAPCHEPPPL